MATAFNGQAADTNVATLFDQASDGGPVTSFVISNRSSSSGVYKVNVQGLHAAGEYVGIEPGLSMPFRSGINGITKITGKSASTSTIDGGVTSKR